MTDCFNIWMAMIPVAVAPPYTKTGIGFSAGLEGRPVRFSASESETAKQTVPQPMAPKAAA